MITRSLFTDTMLESALPAIDAVMHQTSRKYPEVRPLIFEQRKSTRGIEQVTEITGLGPFVASDEGEDLVLDSPEQAFDKTYLHTKYRLGFQYSTESLEDGKFREIKQQSKNLIRSAQDTRETLAAAVINGGYSDTGPDGVSLFSASHPKVKAGGVQSNLIAAADLDVPSLMDMLTIFRTWEHHSGIPAAIIPKTLLIPPALEFVAAEILRGDMRSDTANNTINALKHRVGLPSFQQILLWVYLTDVDSWQVLAAPDDTGLAWYERKKLKVKAWQENKSDSAIVAGRMRFSVGYDHYLGVAGSPGQ